MSPEVLEEIRLLGNFEDAEQKLLQILLVGQCELDDVLNRDDLRQLKQRVALRLSIGPLAATEVGQYIRHRWLRAGGAEPPFSMDAVVDIAQASRGIPRLINALCENALILAFGEGSPTVERRHVQAATADLRMCVFPTPSTAKEPATSASAEFVMPILERRPVVEKPSAWMRWTHKLTHRRDPLSMGPRGNSTESHSLR